MIANALEPCPSCKNPCSPNAVACPKCGEPFEPDWTVAVIKQRNKDATHGSLIIAAPVIIGILLIWGGDWYDAVVEYRHMEALRVSNPAEYRRTLNEKQRQKETAKKEEQRKEQAELAAEREKKRLSKEESEATVQCMRLVRSQSANSDEYDFHTLSTKNVLKNGIFVRTGKVDLMNHFGAMITYRYYCKISKGKLLDFRIW